MKALSVSDAIYESNWINFDNNLRKAMILVIQRSHKEVPIRIGEMLVLNLETFTSVITNSFLIFAY